MTKSFSKPGRTNAIPIYFDTPEQANEECQRVEKSIPGTLMVMTAVFIFRPEEQPIEKTERLKALSYEAPEEAKLLAQNLTLVQQERVMIKITHDSLMMMIIYLN